MGVEVSAVHAGGSGATRVRCAARALLTTQDTAGARALVERANRGDRQAGRTLTRVARMVELRRHALRVELAGRTGRRTPDRARRAWLRAQLAACAALLDALSTWAPYRAATAYAADVDAQRRDDQGMDSPRLAATVQTVLAETEAAEAWQRFSRTHAREHPPQSVSEPRVQPRAPRAPALPVWAGLCR